MATKINSKNFDDLTIWVSSPCKSKKTGNTTYWCTIDEFQNGALLYLSRSVWEGLDEVNEDTVFAKLNEGGFEITEAHSRETGELMYSDTTGEQIFQISRAKTTKKFKMTCE